MIKGFCISDVPYIDEYTLPEVYSQMNILSERSDKEVKSVDPDNKMDIKYYDGDEIHITIVSGIDKEERFMSMKMVCDLLQESAPRIFKVFSDLEQRKFIIVYPRLEETDQPKGFNVWDRIIEELFRLTLMVLVCDEIKDKVGFIKNYISHFVKWN